MSEKPFEEIHTPVLEHTVEGAKERLPNNFDVERDMGDGTLEKFRASIAFMENAADREKAVRELLYLSPAMAQLVKRHSPVQGVDITDAESAATRSFPSDESRKKYEADLLELILVGKHDEEVEALSKNVKETTGQMLDANAKLNAFETLSFVRNAAQLVALGGEYKISPALWRKIQDYAKEKMDSRNKLRYAVAATYLSRNAK